MPIHYTYGNILDSNADALINTVNCVGVMGAGLAKQFKERFPHCFAIYKNDCNLGKVNIGQMHIVPGTPTIINFPTKLHWRNTSETDYVERGLHALKRYLEQSELKSIAVPPLGCGLGGLDWQKDVNPLITQYLGNLPINVEVYVPENLKMPQISEKRQLHILVTGGREFTNYQVIENALNTLNPTKITHGGAKGADRLAGTYANFHNIENDIHLPDWDKHGKSAGMIRNQTMLEASNPDLVLAFPGDKGTNHMIDYAHKKGYKVLKVNELANIRFDTKIINMRNFKNSCPSYAIRIDRQSKWGNPFKLQDYPDTAIPKFEEYLRTALVSHQIPQNELADLAGHVLACWCTPNHCHGDIIAYYAHFYATQLLTCYSPE